MPTIIVPVVKGKATMEIETDPSKLPDAVYAEALALGLKELVNRGMSKVTAAAFPNEEERKAEAMRIASENVEKIYKGDIKFSGPKAAKTSGVVMTEARRLAKALVKDGLKKAGIKISHVPAKEITAAANQLLAADPSILETAKANVEARSKTEIKIDVASLVKVDPALVAKAEEKKSSAKAAGQLSAKQAGKTAPRKPSKPSAQVQK